MKKRFTLIFILGVLVAPLTFAAENKGNRMPPEGTLCSFSSVDAKDAQTGDTREPATSEGKTTGTKAGSVH